MPYRLATCAFPFGSSRTIAAALCAGMLIGAALGPAPFFERVVADDDGYFLDDLVVPEAPDFASDRKTVGDETFLREDAFAGERVFEADLPTAICDGETTYVESAGTFRPWEGGPLGWRPGRFLEGRGFDLRGWIWWPRFGHRDPDDPLRHHDWGEPMTGTSWRNRPVSVDWFFGGTATAGLTESTRQTGGTVGGYRLGYDFDHYWGLEWRHLWASANLRSSEDVTYDATTQNQFFDVNLVWYPWGDSRWRPYAGIGLGMANYDFVDASGWKVDETMLTLPLSAGLKYYIGPWAVLRVDLSETIVFPGSDVDTHAQFMATVGTEFRFGGKRTKYYPWQTGWSP